MMKVCFSTLLAVTMFILAMNQPVEASILTPPSKQDIQQLLDQAGETQFSLSEKHYSWEAALEKLSPFMTQEFAINFMEEHLFLEEEGYIFYGTDFSIFLIPPFSFNEKTSIVVNPQLQSTYIYEKFTGTGPVEFEEQYEIVTLVQEDSKWKIAKISFLDELPEEVKSGTSLDKYSSTSDQNLSVSTVNSHKKIAESHTSNHVASSFTFNPLNKMIWVVPYLSIFEEQFKDNRYKGNDTLLTLSNIIWQK